MDALEGCQWDREEGQFLPRARRLGTPLGKGIERLSLNWRGSSGDLCFSSASRICLSAGVSCLLLLCLVGPAMVLLTMGQGSSTPLSLMIDHFSDFRTKAHNLSMEVKKNKLITLCSAEWLIFSVDWPQEGTFDLQTIQALKHWVLSPGLNRHPDQSPYILVWHSMVKDPPKWPETFSFSGVPRRTPDSSHQDPAGERETQAGGFSRFFPLFQPQQLRSPGCPSSLCSPARDRRTSPTP